MGSTRTRGQFTVRDSDPLVNSHRVSDIHILPGVALLDAVYKTLQARRMDIRQLCLREILFHEPVVTNAQIDRKLSVTLDMTDAHGQISVTSLPWKHERALSSTPTTHMTCRLVPSTAFSADCALAPLANDSLELDACYAVTRHIGIFHEGFMKCEGRVARLSSGEHLGEVTLGAAAQARATDFLLHPVLLDCSTIVPLFPLRDRLDQASLFIPFAIDEFQAVALSGHSEVRVLVEPLDDEIAGREVVRYSFGIFDRGGRKLAAFRNFTVKKVRSLQNVRALLERSLSAHASPILPGPEVAISRDLDPISNLIGEVLARQGQIVWAPEQVQKPFFDLGLASLELLEAAEELEKRLSVRLYPTSLFENPNVAALTAYLRATYPDECEAYAKLATRSHDSGPVARPPAVDAKAPADAVLELIATLVRPHNGGNFSREDAAKPLLELADALEQRLGVRLYPTMLFERPNAAALCAQLWEEFPDACARYAATAKGSSTAAPSAPITIPARPIHAPTAVPTTVPAEASRLVTLVPRWFPVRAELTQSTAKAIALVDTGSGAALTAALRVKLESRLAFCGSVHEFGAALANQLACDEVWLVAIDHDAAFNSVKQLIQSNALGRVVSLKAITLDCFQVHDEPVRTDAGHGVWGVLQSASREYPQVSVAQLDLCSSELLDGEDDWIAHALAATETRTLRALRAGRVYERRLCAVRANRERANNAFRTGGTYLVVGGASGVGLEFVRHLRRNYAAKVAVVGRRPETAELVRVLSAEGDYGRELTYVSAAAEDEAALKGAIELARERLGELNGVVHSAMVLEDARLAEMDSAAFERVLMPKCAGAQALARATAGLELDFLLFFSSAQSFIGNLGQANYAAASTYLDGFAAGLRSQRAYPILVVNWGYWSEVGAVASERYRQLLARQGVFGLKATEALSALEAMLTSGWEQAMIVAAEEPVLREMRFDRSLTIERPRVASPEQAAAVVVPLSREDTRAFAETEDAMRHLLELTRRRVAQILRELLAGRSVEEALAASALAAPHARLVRTLLKVTGTADSQGCDQADFQLGLAELGARFPSLEALIPLLEACISAYPALLAGKALAPNVLFPGGSVELVRSVYGQSAVSRFYNERVAEGVLSLAQRAGAPLRILEIGAGTGSTTVEVLNALARAGVESDYCYTDLWDKLVNDAKERLAPRFPQLRFAFLDIGNDPSSQGWHEEFDIVIATNVLHATRDLHVALGHAKKLLRPAGALVLNESVEVKEYSTYTFGLLPGWWNASDSHERLPDSPLASATTWPALLRDEGFVHVRCLVPADSGSPAVSAQQVYLAVSDGELRVSTGKRPPPATHVAHAPGVPAVLAGKLRPFEPLAAPRPKHLATFRDPRENVWVFLNNPPANMFSDEFLGELCATLQSVATLSPVAGRIVYLSHFGEYFSLGGDRSELVRHLGDADALRAFADKAKALIRVITSLDALVVAVVDGSAQGGGFETLLATDLQFVRTGVKLGLPEIKSGLVPGMGGLSYLQSLLGPARTKRLVLTGELIDAAEAHALGVISHVVEDPFTTALSLGEELKHLDSALYMKRLLRRETAELLAADIDDWLNYLTCHADWIDTRRISNSRLVVAGRAAMKAS